jgi:membrane protein
VRIPWPRPLAAAGRGIAAFFRLAYEAGITGLAGMVSYSLLLSLFPLALLSLFVGSQVLASPAVQNTIIHDLTTAFPNAAEGTLRNLLGDLRRSSTGLGILSAIASVYVASTFWGAVETAFARIYGLQGRSWPRQKRFALIMLLVELVFMAVTVLVPTLQGLLVAGAHNLPLGIGNVNAFLIALVFVFDLVLLFGLLCLTYWAVPNGRLPWRAIWPGALGVTFAIAVVDFGFPLYFNHFSTLSRFGTTFGFVLVVLVWFYVLAIVLLGGAVLNALILRQTGLRPPRRPVRAR